MVVAASIAIQFLADRMWPATILAFGPRWVLAVPLLPLALAALRHPRKHTAIGLLAVLSLATLLIVGPVMDVRLGTGRASGIADVRVMTFNLGESRMTGKDLDVLMRAEGVDVAALQECPFYDLEPARFGWHFFYGGDLCLVSRFPFTVLDEPDPATVWMRYGRRPLRFAVDGPRGTFQLLNVHFETVRGGLDALRTHGWRALAEFSLNRQQAERDSRSARARISADSRPLLVAGDFNLPVESAIYRQQWGDLVNAFSRCGRGLGHTKFTSLHGVRIDHVLASDHWSCTDARVLQAQAGGDHAPLVVDLQFSGSRIQRP